MPQTPKGLVKSLKQRQATKSVKKMVLNASDPKGSSQKNSLDYKTAVKQFQTD